VVKRGFSLVEVIVGLALLSLLVLGSLATLAIALRTQREVLAHADALILAAATLDSLAMSPTVAREERVIGRYTLRWQARLDGGIAWVGLTIEFHDGTFPRRLEFSMAHSAPPLRPAGDS